MKEIDITCVCGCSIIKISYDEYDGGFTINHYRLGKHYYSFWKRLKFLFTGNISYCEEIISRTDAKRLAFFINENTEL